MVASGREARQHEHESCGPVADDPHRNAPVLLVHVAGGELGRTRCVRVVARRRAHRHVQHPDLDTARRRIGQRAWRALHYLTFLAFAGSTVHGIAAGTDSSAGWAQWLYLGSMTVVAFLLTYRIGISMVARAEARQRGREREMVPLGRTGMGRAA